MDTLFSSPFRSEFDPNNPPLSLADCSFTEAEKERLAFLLSSIGIPPEKQAAYQQHLIGVLYTLVDALFREAQSQAELTDLP